MNTKILMEHQLTELYLLARAQRSAPGRRWPGHEVAAGVWVLVIVLLRATASLPGRVAGVAGPAPTPRSARPA